MVLGIEDEEDEKNNGRYKLLAAENRTGQYKHNDIENQVVHLHICMAFLTNHMHSLTKENGPYGRNSC